MTARGKIKSLSLISTAVMLLATSSHANAQESARPLALTNIADNTQISAANFQAGNQAYAGNHNGELIFAGQSVATENFSGVLGMSSDVAYIMVISGRASIGAEGASRGRILLIPPFGDQVSVERFDAAMFLGSLSDEAKGAQPQMVSELSDIARGQKREKFWGTLRPTGRNVNALRSVAKENERRDLLNNKAMQQVRFAGLASEKAVGEKTIRTFVDALMANDVASIAALLDPMQFGGTSMRGGGKAARELAARQIAGAYMPASTQVIADTDDDSWMIDTRSGQRTVKLRRIDDLYFVQSIS